MGITCRLTHPGVLLIAIGLLALGLKRVNGASPRHVRLPFEATLAGVSGGGSVWEGLLHGARGGRARLTLYQVESPLEAARPVWHARAQWTVDADSPERSFTAELEGMWDWKSGATRLSGVVTSGRMQAARRPAHRRTATSPWQPDSARRCSPTASGTRGTSLWRRAASCTSTPGAAGTTGTTSPRRAASSSRCATRRGTDGRT